MRKACLLFALTGAVALAADDARGVLDSVAKALGTPRTLQYTGSGAVFTVGQNLSPTKPWPRVELKSFTRVVDYENRAWRQEGVGAAGPTAVQFWSGDRAWQQSGANVVAAAPAVAAERQLQYWMTPHAFVKGALAGRAEVRSKKISGRRVALVTFTEGKLRLTGTLSADRLVEKIETRFDNPVLGDMPVETVFSDYRDFGAVKFPTRIAQTQGGHPSFEVTVTAAQPNVPAPITVPAAVRQAPPPAPAQVASQKLADGVWYLTGGSHHSVAVEFADHAAVIEAPLGEERSAAVIAEVKKLLPAKPIRYLVNTHHHFDHSGGLRTYVAEGATIVTHELNRDFYKKTLRDARTLNPDRQARERRKPKLLAVGARHVLTDGARKLELHHIQGSPHNDGILMAYLPKEKLLVEVDVYTPLAPNAPRPATPNPAMVNLYENVERLKLDVAQIAPLHGRLVGLAELRRTIGK